MINYVTYSYNSEKTENYRLRNTTANQSKIPITNLRSCTKMIKIKPITHLLYYYTHFYYINYIILRKSTTNITSHQKPFINIHLLLIIYGRLQIENVQWLSDQWFHPVIPAILLLYERQNKTALWLWLHQSPDTVAELVKCLKKKSTLPIGRRVLTLVSLLTELPIK